MQDRRPRDTKIDDSGLDAKRTDPAAGPGSGRTVVIIDYDLCDDAGTCATVCPEEVFEFKNGHSQVIDASSCTECWICVENCASGAIEIR
jgi:NAD-dependent dihydropyrimidine dehydrogenase PreA subunit